MVCVVLHEESEDHLDIGELDHRALRASSPPRMEAGSALLRPGKRPVVDLAMGGEVIFGAAPSCVESARRVASVRKPLREIPRCKAKDFASRHS